MEESLPEREVIPGGVRLALPPRTLPRAVGIGLIFFGVATTAFMVFWMGGAGGWWDGSHGRGDGAQSVDWFRLGFALLGAPMLALGLGLIYGGIAVLERSLRSEISIDQTNLCLRERAGWLSWSWPVPLVDLRSLHLHLQEGQVMWPSLRLRRRGHADFSVGRGYARAQLVALGRMIVEEVRQRGLSSAPLPLLERSDEGPAPGTLGVLDAGDSLTIRAGWTSWRVAQGVLTLRDRARELSLPISEVRSITVPTPSGSGSYNVHPGSRSGGVGIPVVIARQAGPDLVARVRGDTVTADWIARRLNQAVFGHDTQPATALPVGNIITVAALPASSPVLIRDTVDGVRIVCPVRGLGADHGSFAVGILVMLFSSGFMLVPLLVSDMPLLVRGFVVCFCSIFILIGGWAALFGLRVGTRHTAIDVAGGQLRITWRDRLGGGSVDHPTVGLVAISEDTGTRTNDKIHWRLSVHDPTAVVWKGGQELDRDEQLAVAAALNRAFQLGAPRQQFRADGPRSS